MAGVVVLVMAAVGLSVVNDRQGLTTRNRGLVREDLASGAAEIAELRARRDQTFSWLAERQRTAPVNPRPVEDFSERRNAVMAAKSGLVGEIEELEGSFASYRVRQRRSVRTAAIGTPLGDLAIRGGRVYRHAVIARVTDAGLEIRHSDGLARISSVDLNADLQKQYGWEPPEAAPVAPVAAVANLPAPDVPRKRNQVEPKVDAEELRVARELLSSWTAQVAALAADQRNAAARAASGFRKSVPGSLETWGAKAQRLERDLSRARLALAQARANLATISPEDPALRPVVAEE